MLIGEHRTVSELIGVMEERATDINMEIRTLEKEHSEIAIGMRTNPPQRGTEDDRPTKLLALQKVIEAKHDEVNWIEGKLEEAVTAVEKDSTIAQSKTYLTLNDMLRLGIESSNSEE